MRSKTLILIEMFVPERVQVNVPLCLTSLQPLQHRADHQIRYPG